MAKFQKGQSGNPKGRPKKGTALTELLEAEGEVLDVDKLDPSGAKLQRKKILAKRMWLVAMSDPDSATARYIFDRIDGKPTETLHHQGKDGGPIVVKFDKSYEGA